MTQAERTGFFIASLAAMSVSGCLSRTDWVVAELDSTWPAGWFEMGGSGSAGGVGGTVWFGGESLRIEIDSFGRPTVSWEDGTGVAFYTYLRRWDGASWQELGASASGGGISGSTNYPAGSDLALDRNEEPVVTFAYELTSLGGLGIYVSAWTGSAWTPLETAFQRTLLRYPALAVDSVGRVAVAWEQLWPFTGYEREICLLRGAAGGWAELGGSGTGPTCLTATPGHSEKPSLVLDDQDRPIVAWAEDRGSTANVYLRRWSGSTWEELDGSGSGDGIGVGYAQSAAVDSQGGPWVSWDATDAPSPSIYVRRWRNGVWGEVGGSATGTGISGPHDARNSALVLDPHDRPIVAYYVSNGPAGAAIYVKYWDGSAWREIDGSATGAGVSAASTPVAHVAIAAAAPGFCVAWPSTVYNVMVRCRPLP